MAKPFPAGPAWAAQRHRIEHASLLHDDTIGLMQRMAISPSFLTIGRVMEGVKDDASVSENDKVLKRC